MDVTARPRRLESTAVIRFSDCDPFAHLNNSRYLEYLLNAREDQMALNYQFSPYQLVKKTGVTWLMTEHRIAYLRPAAMNETVAIRSHITRWGPKDMTLEVVMSDAGKDSVKALLWSVCVHFNVKTMRTEAHSQELNDFFQPLEDPLEGAPSFEERCAQLRRDANF